MTCFTFFFFLFFFMILTDDFSKKTAGMGPGSRIFFNFCDFCFSWTRDHALSNLENFDCQGHNSLNFDQIFKIFVPKHISFPRPFIFIYWTTMWHVPRGQKRVLKIVNEKWKSQKLKKMTFPISCQQTLGRILDLHKISYLLG